MAALHRWVGLFLVCVLSACSSGEETASNTLLDLRFFHAGGLGLPITDAPIDALRITVVDSERQEIVSRQVLTRDSNGQSTLREVPFGEGLQFFVEALDASNEVLAVGGTNPLSVLEGATTARRYVLMTTQGQTTPTSAIYGGGEVGPEVGPSEFSDTSKRAGHQAVTLQDGRVLVIGGADLTTPGQGIGGSNFALIHDSVLVYDINDGGGYFDPAINADTGEPLRMSGPRVYHSATLLSDGTVLVVGGYTTFNGTDLTTQIAVDLITPTANGEFALEAIGGLTFGRARHSATLIEGDQVLVVGGETVGQTPDARQYLNVVERFDPSLGVTSTTLAMASPRSQHAAAALDNRQVLICGGRTETAVLSDCEVYVQVGAAAQMLTLTSMQSPRYGHAAISLPDRPGQVMIAGGYTSFEPGQLTGSVEIFDRELGSFDATRALTLTQARAELQLLDLQRKRQVVAIGGLNIQGLAVGGVDLFTPLSNRGDAYTSQEVATLTQGRYGQSATRLSNGLVLCVAGATRPAADQTITLSSSDIINLGLPDIIIDAEE